MPRFREPDSLIMSSIPHMQTLCWFYFNSKEGAPVKKASVLAVKSFVEASLLDKEEVVQLYKR
jgi:hypothetical protein